MGNTKNDAHYLFLNVLGFDNVELVADTSVHQTTL